MRKRKFRTCWWCLRPIDVKQTKTYVSVERRSWLIAKQYLYHKACWQRKCDSEAMRKYRERMGYGYYS